MRAEDAEPQGDPLPPRLSRRLVGLMLAVAATTFLLQLYLFRDLQHDDAYISFRYARNIARGHGFVFNLGERTLGTSSPLFTLWMSVPHWLGLDARWAALVTSALALRVMGVALFLLLRRRSFDVAVTVFLFTCMGGLGMLEMALLETLTVGALAVCATAAFGERRPWLAGVLLGLAFVGRYDAVLLAPLLAGAHWLRERTLPLKMLGAALATVLPWLVFATVYFGSPMPTTLSAKALLTPFGSYLAHYLEFIYEIPGLAIPWPIGLALTGAGLALFVRERSLAAIVLVLHGALHLLTYAAIGPPEVQHWHNYLPVLSFRVAMLAGLLGWADVSRLRARLTPLTAVVSALLCSFVGFHTQQRARTIKSQFWLGQRHSQYVTVAEYLDAHVPADGRLMATEVGTLGYLTDRHMLDVFGLVSPTNAFPRTQAFVDYIELVEMYRPEILLMDDPDQGRLLASATEYELVKIFPWQRPWSTLLVRRGAKKRGADDTHPARPR